MGDAFMARRSDGSTYRYDNLLKITREKNSSGQEYILKVTLPDGLTWADVEYFSFYFRNTDDTRGIYPVRKISDTAARMTTYMWYDILNYVDIPLDPSGNSFTYNVGMYFHWSDWNVVWLRKRI